MTTAVAQRECRMCGAAIPATAHKARIYCSVGCRQAWSMNYSTCCPCGAFKSRNAQKCHGCRQAEWDQERAERWDRLEALWAEGLSMADIADQVGTTRNALGTEIDRARKAGRSFPLRRANTPKEGSLTKEECRFQFGGALRAHKIRRATRCEGCGFKGHVDGHHEDYQRPLYVIWLCRACHTALHIAERGQVKRKAAA